MSKRFLGLLLTLGMGLPVYAQMDMNSTAEHRIVRLPIVNPVDTFVAYGGIGCVNVFGGGLALYNAQGQLLGAVGVSGDSSCADHNIAWRTRHTLHLDYVPAGVSGDTTRPDNIVYDITNPAGFPIGVSANGWGHPACSPAATTIAGELPAIP
jgi:hypothetical protein